MTATVAPTSTDRIEKRVILDASPSRVWRALTDAAQFSSWFGVKLTAPFVPGEATSGLLNFKGYEHVTLTVWTERMEPERFFSFRWHPYPIQEGIELDGAPTTLVTFTLEPAGSGTELTIVESGFDALPESRRTIAFSMNTKGWNGQAENIRKFLANGDVTPEGGRLPHLPE